MKAYNLFLQEGHGPLSETQELPYATTGAYVDMLIDNELLYQEARRQGLSPSEDDVVTFARQSKEALAAVAAGGSQLGEELTIALASVAGTSFDLDTYDTNPEMLDAFRRTLTIGMLRTQIIDAALPDANARSRDEMEEAVQEAVGQLRRRGDRGVRPAVSVPWRAVFIDATGGHSIDWGVHRSFSE